MTRNEILQIKSLADKKERFQRRLFVAEGPKLVEELLESSLAVQTLYVTGDYPDGPASVRISSKEMERISQLKTPSKVLGVFRIPLHPLKKENLLAGLSLVLDDVQDPGNLGTILRNADWFGIRNVICSRNTADCYNPKVVQATMGAIARVAVHYVDLPEWLAEIKGELPVFGTFLPGENIYQTELSPNGLIVLGSEGKGISSTVAEHINRRLYIPPFPPDVLSSESLNVAVATGIICSEFRRRA